MELSYQEMPDDDLMLPQVVPGAQKSEADQDSRPEECNVCYSLFSEETRRPRTLPCGHSYCTSCLEDLLSEGRLVCPSCRAEHFAPRATYFPVNFILEAVIRKLRTTQLMLGWTEQNETMVLVPDLTAAPPPRGVTGAVARHTVRSVPSTSSAADRVNLEVLTLTANQGATVSNLHSACQEALSQLDRYRGQLDAWTGQHKHAVDRLQAMTLDHQNALQLLGQETHRVSEALRQGRDGSQQLQHLLDARDAPPPAVAACTLDVQEWILHCRDLFPDVHAVHTSLKVLESSSTALDRQQRDDGGTSGRGAVLPPAVSLEELCRIEEPMHRVVGSGRVFAVGPSDQQDPPRRASRLTTDQHGRLFLHALHDLTPPPDSLTLLAEEVVERASRNPVVWLGLGWGGRERGRVLVKLQDSPLARQFLLLCTGLRVHTYLGTPLLDVWRARLPGESVVGGDYEHLDGSGGAPLMPHLHGMCSKSNKAGVVWAAWGPESSRAAQFGITTREHIGCYVNVFGCVEEGLEVVRAAAAHPNIREVTVVDCGLLLSDPSDP